jgi:hypothetical protein
MLSGFSSGSKARATVWPCLVRMCGDGDAWRVRDCGDIRHWPNHC